MQIFLIAGKSGSGKDELAKIIKNYYEKDNKKVVITGFSKYIKLFAMEILDWDGKNPKPRKFLQDFGEDARNKNERIFINRMVEDIKLYQKYCDALVIADGRLIKEIEVLKKEVSDVCTIHVIAEKSKNQLTAEEKSHITETELDDYQKFDYTIKNNFDETLKEDVYKILKGMNLL